MSKIAVSCPIRVLHSYGLAVLQEHASGQNFQRGPHTIKQSPKSQISGGHWVEVLSKLMGREEGHSGIVVK